MKGKTVLLVTLVCLSFVFKSQAEPVLSRAQVKADQVILTGSGFGKTCRTCEVIADFNGFKYSLPVKAWSDTKVSAVYRDIGKGEHSRISIAAADGTSRAMRARINVLRQPPTRPHKFTTANNRDAAILFSKKYKLTIGGKGTDQFDVSQAPARCGSSAMVFDSAYVFLGPRTRFGEARLISTPRPGCTKCRPLKVGYYWEPTGRLEYQVHVMQRKIDGICEDNIRR